MPNTEHEREHFEAWMRSVGYEVPWHFHRRTDCANGYMSEVVNQRWIAWLAAKADASTVTEERIEAGARASAEAAGFDWRYCYQEQWKRDAKACLTAALAQPQGGKE